MLTKQRHFLRSSTCITRDDNKSSCWFHSLETTSGWIIIVAFRDLSGERFFHFVILCHGSSRRKSLLFRGNIPGGDVGKGDVVCDYLQPFPPKGTGYHRLVFILYKQDKRIDFTKYQKTSPCYSLKERTFCTYDFYKEHQDFITPGGLAFFQCQYDENMRDFFHNVLQMREPMFEYDHPPPFIRTQVKTPHHQPFNLYLDKYRDPKDIAKEILLKRFKNIHPFHGEPPKSKYPNAQLLPKTMPSWQKTEAFKERMRIGKYRGLEVEVFKPERPQRLKMWDDSGKDREYE